MLIKTYLIENKTEKETRILVVTHGGFIMEFINVVKRIHGK
jgi:broad specificity phosphatase PhoE